MGVNELLDYVEQNLVSDKTESQHGLLIDRVTRNLGIFGVNGNSSAFKEVGLRNGKIRKGVADLVAIVGDHEVLVIEGTVFRDNGHPTDLSRVHLQLVRDREYFKSILGFSPRMIAVYGREGTEEFEYHELVYPLQIKGR